MCYINKLALPCLMIFGIKKYNFDPYNAFLAIATHIPQQLKSAFVLQGHIYAQSWVDYLQTVI